MSDSSKAGSEEGVAGAPSLVMTSAGAAPTQAVRQVLVDTDPYPFEAEPALKGVHAQKVMAMVHSFPGTFAPNDERLCVGQQLNPMQHTALFSILGVAYGGDGRRNFNLPNLAGRVAVSGTPLGAVSGNALTMTYMIVADAREGFPMVGMIGLFAGPFAPGGWRVADGSSLAISDYEGLHRVIGNNFGGDGASFNLPDLTGRAAIGVGAGPGRAPVTLGEVVDGGPGAIPALGLTYLIATQGQFPTGERGLPYKPTLSEIVAFAGPGLPVGTPGWALCDGSLLAIMKNQELFTIIGPSFGGDGIRTFGLPDLHGHVLTGTR